MNSSFNLGEVLPTIIEEEAFQGGLAPVPDTNDFQPFTRTGDFIVDRIQCDYDVTQRAATVIPVAHDFLSLPTNVRDSLFFESLNVGSDDGLRKFYRKLHRRHQLLGQQIDDLCSAPHIDFDKLRPIQFYYREIGAALRRIYYCHKRTLDVFDSQGFFTDLSKSYSDARKSIEFFNRIKTGLAYKPTNSDHVIENLQSRFEDLLLFLTELSGIRTWPAMIAAILSYIRTWYPQPIHKIIFSWVMEAFEFSSEMIEGFFVGDVKLHSQADFSEYSDKMTDFSAILSSYSSHKDLPFARNVVNVVNILIAYKFFPSPDGVPALKAFLKRFGIRVWDVQNKSESFNDMVMDTAMFFIERGYSAYVNNDMSLFVFGDHDAAEFEQEYARVTAAIGMADAGNEEGMRSFGFANTADYSDRLTKLINLTVTKIAELKQASGIKTHLTNCLAQLYRCQATLAKTALKSSIVEAAYGILLYGKSGVGKSTLINILMKTALSAGGFPNHSTNIMTMNPQDKYEGTSIKPEHTAILLDDAANARQDTCPEVTPPSSLVIKLVNNISMPLNAAEISLKGQVVARHKVFAVTTNTKGLSSELHSNEPASIMRRFRCILTVTLKPEFVDPETGGLKQGSYPSVPDIWNITLERARMHRKPDTDGGDGKINQKHDEVRYDVVKQNIGVHDLIDWIIDDARTYFDSQRAYVNTTQDLLDSDFCIHHRHPQFCKFCRKLDSQMFFNPLGDFDTDNEETIHRVHSSIVSGEELPLMASVVQANRALGITARIANSFQSVGSLLEVIRNERKKALAFALGSCAIASGVYLFIKIKKGLENPCFSSHGISESSFMRITNQDRPANPWKSVSIAEIPTSLESQHSDWRKVENKILRSIGFARVHLPNGVANTNVMPLKGIFWAIPNHVLPSEGEVRIDVVTSPRDELSRTFSQRVSREDVRVVNGDIAIVPMPNGGSIPDFVKFFPESDLANGHGIFGSLIMRNRDGVSTIHELRSKKLGPQRNEHAEFQALTYETSTATMRGMCCAPVIARRRSPAILGLHIAGISGTRMGACALLTRPQLEEAIGTYPTYFQSHSEGTMETEICGISYKPEPRIDERATQCWVPADEAIPSNAIVYGTIAGDAVNARSNVVPTVITKEVEEVLGIPNIHGPPKLYNYNTHYKRDFDLVSHPTGDFKMKYLKLAHADFNAKLQAFIKSDPGLCKASPLAWLEAINGIDGMTGMDRVDGNTSMGIPFNKKKKNFVVDTDIEYPGISTVRDFEDSRFREYADRMEACLLSGERIHVVFRCMMKDEPTKLTKTKVRIFSGCQVIFSILFRKYFLPISRMMQLNNGQFECAIGMNSFKTEWDTMTKHLVQFGEDRIVAGDYAAYDKSLPGGLMMMAFDLLINVASQCNYSANDLVIMRGLATEVCNPIYVARGVVYQAFGSNPSGQPMTAPINSLCNSLLMRYVDQVVHDGKTPSPFHHRVALMTLGDDNIMGVSEDCPLFNHTAIQNIMAQVGITYTMPDKESESVPYSNISELDFLKRTFRRDEDTGNWMGPIAEPSIMKSLHNRVIKNKDVLPEEVAGAAISKARQEYFQYGRTIFEERDVQLREIARRAGIEGFLPYLKSYQEYLDDYFVEDPVGDLGAEQSKTLLDTDYEMWE